MGRPGRQAVTSLGPFRGSYFTNPAGGTSGALYLDGIDAYGGNSSWTMGSYCFFERLTDWWLLMGVYKFESGFHLHLVGRTTRTLGIDQLSGETDLKLLEFLRLDMPSKVRSGRSADKPSRSHLVPRSPTMTTVVSQLMFGG